MMHKPRHFSTNVLLVSSLILIRQPGGCDRNIIKKIFQIGYFKYTYMRTARHIIHINYVELNTNGKSLAARGRI